MSSSSTPPDEKPSGGGLSLATKLAIIANVAPKYSEGDVNQLVDVVMEVHKKVSASRVDFVIPATVHTKLRCKVCGNRDERFFTALSKGGDVVCNGKDGEGCGNVVEEHRRHEGAAFRNFAEDNVDRNHHGPAADRLYSAAHNLRTDLSGNSAIAARLRQTSESVELGLSNLGKDEKRTRIGYKDQHKKKAFNRIKGAAMALGLHESIVDRAHELFASLRDDREAVRDFDAVIAACIIIAADEVARNEHTLQIANDHQKNEKDAPPRIAFDEANLATTRRAQLLQKPLAVSSSSTTKRSRDEKSVKEEGKAPPPKQQFRAGRSWLAQLEDI